jgi:hypothetical protein
MDFDTFKSAVNSMKGFSGIVGIMGGEPTIHPEFFLFARYFKNNFGEDSQRTVWRKPGTDFMKHIEQNVFDLYNSNQRGLWSSVTRKYAEHFELIQDTFGYQCLNDHSMTSFHQPLLISRKELGIDDKEWVILRDKCWIQNFWSASITPKGAFFCEIAASLDMLLNGPGGWPVELGWWKRKPKDFADQLHWCELCGAALPLPMRDARMGIDDISPLWADRLAEIKSPKRRRGRVVVFDVNTWSKKKYTVIDNGQPYIADNSQRIAGQRVVLSPRSVKVWLLFDRNTFPENMYEDAALGGGPDELAAVLTDNAQVAAQLRERAFPLFSSQETIAEIASACGAKEWILCCRNAVPAAALLKRLRSMIFNPGVLYRIPSADVPVQHDALFFHVGASSLARGNADLNTLTEVFPARKIYDLPPAFSKDIRMYMVEPEDGLPVHNTTVRNDGIFTFFSPGFAPEATGSRSRQNGTQWPVEAISSDLALLQWMTVNASEDYLGFIRYNCRFIFNTAFDRHALIESDKLRYARFDDIPEDVRCADEISVLECLAEHSVLAPLLAPIRFLNVEDKRCEDYLRRKYGKNVFQALLQSLKDTRPEYIESARVFFMSQEMSIVPFFIMTRKLFLTFHDFAFSVLQRFFAGGTALSLTARDTPVLEGLLNILFNIFLVHIRKAKRASIVRIPYAEATKYRQYPAAVSRLDTEDRPQIHIVSSCGRNTLPYFSVLLASIGENCPDNLFHDIVLLADTLPKGAEYILREQARAYRHIHLRVVDCTTLFPKADQQDAERYARLLLLIGELFPEYDKSLYLAPAVLVMKELKSLFAADFDGHFAAAVPNAIHIETMDDLHGETHVARLDTDVAVLLLNLEAMRNFGIQRKLSQAFRELSPSPVHDVVDSCFQDNILHLPAENNVDTLLHKKDDYPLLLLQQQKIAALHPRICNFNPVSPENMCDTGNIFLACYMNIARITPYYEQLPFAGAGVHAQKRESADDTALPPVIRKIPGPRGLREKVFHILFPRLSIVYHLSRTAAFDIAYYLACNPDVARDGINPVLHYVFRGEREGRRPNDWFDAASYLAQHPDAASHGRNIFFNYLVQYKE